MLVVVTSIGARLMVVQPERFHSLITLTQNSALRGSSGSGFQSHLKLGREVKATRPCKRGSCASLTGEPIPIILIGIGTDSRGIQRIPLTT